MKRFAAGLLVGLILGGGAAVWSSSFGYYAVTEELSFPIVQVVVNGKALTFAEDDVPAMLLGGRVILPLRAVAEVLGAEVQWDGESYTTIVDTTGIQREGVKVVEGALDGNAMFGQAITTNGVTVTVDVDYDQNGLPIISLAVSNRGTDIILGPTKPRRLGITLSNPSLEAEFDRVTPSSEPGMVDRETLEPGQDATMTFLYKTFWPGVTITSVTYSYFPLLEGGLDQPVTVLGQPVTVGTWTAP
ncbi:MAG: copper amine oxidase N-terminal domain-containing protein [Bacillota bacterium]|nr:MAG: copper amine oxidase N-terminal domain-containing protein [Bacillota bacterium]